MWGVVFLSLFFFFFSNKSMITALTLRMNRIISKPINLWQNGWVDRNKNGAGESGRKRGVGWTEWAACVQKYGLGRKGANISRSLLTSSRQRRVWVQRLYLTNTDMPVLLAVSLNGEMSYCRRHRYWKNGEENQHQKGKVDTEERGGHWSLQSYLLLCPGPPDWL